MSSVWKRCAGTALAVAVGVSAAGAQTAPITLNADLTDAPRKILHATEVMPVTPGPLTIVYPKWIPGEHGPTGPIENMAGFFIMANGQPVKWERDKVDMFAYHLTVPQGVTKLEMKIDFLASWSLSGFSAGGSTSENLALLSWNTLLVYPADTNASEVMFTPSVTVPAGWKFGTALDKDGGSGQTTMFKTVSLEQLIDSPVLSGRYFREVALAPRDFAQALPRYGCRWAGAGGVVEGTYCPVRQIGPGDWCAL
jgi:predicted metalloprotease with PDZ domain